MRDAIVSAVPSRVINIDDLRQKAQARLPRIVFDYLDGGADNEVTLRENCRVYDDVVFRPRFGVALPDVDMRTTVLGQQIQTPMILAPIGSSRMFWPRAEALAAAAAGKAGTIYTLSTLSGTRLEEVKAATRGPCWYQLYLCGGRDVARAAIDRAAAAGYSALVVTIDTPVAGNRERDPRNGTKELLSGNPLKMLPFVPQLVAHPRWLVGFLADGGLMQFPNVVLTRRSDEVCRCRRRARIGGGAVGRPRVDSCKLARPNRRQGCPHRRGRRPRDRRRRRRDHRVESRRPSARHRRADASRACPKWSTR